MDPYAAVNAKINDLAFQVSELEARIKRLRVYRASIAVALDSPNYVVVELTGGELPQIATVLDADADRYVIRLNVCGRLLHVSRDGERRFKVSAFDSRWDRAAEKATQ